MSYALIDFESRSHCDLRACGAYVYSEHPTTEVICLGYTIDGVETKLWKPGDPVPQDLFDAIAAGAWIIAHNVLFERAIWKNVMEAQWGWPAVPDDQWYDTMASCARKALPLDLDKASRLLRLNYVKDDEGHRAMMKICKPMGKERKYNEDPELYQKVYEYCPSDVDTENALLHKVRFIEKNELDIWRLNQKMNLRGLHLDMKYVADCQAVIDKAMPPLKEEFEDIVGCVAGSHAKVKDWVNAHVEHKFDNLQRETVEDALEHRNDLPANVRRALELKLQVTSTSITKLKAMRNCVSADSRARGLIQYHGATTGRDAGRLLQPQNFPRGVVEGSEDEDGEYVPAWDILVPAVQSRDIEFIQALVMKKDGDSLVSCNPIEAVSSGIRYAITASPGKLLMAGDFSTIEARVVLALAGQHDRLDLIRKGLDMYCDFGRVMYGRVFDKKIDIVIRQNEFKPSVLGSGFGMGAEKFWLKYMKYRPFEVAKKCIDTYRQDWAPLVPKLWYGLEEAATKAVWDRVPSEYSGVEYRIEDEWLTARMPSGRKLYYFNPRQCRKAMPWDPNDIRPGWQYTVKKAGQIRQVDAYGGLLTENVVQALARDLLYDRALVAEREGLPLVLTVHDEIVTEPDEDKADQNMLQQIMEDAPAWARDLGVPVTAECWTGERYRK